MRTIAQVSSPPSSEDGAGVVPVLFVEVGGGGDVAPGAKEFSNATTSKYGVSEMETAYSSQSVMFVILTDWFSLEISPVMVKVTVDPPKTGVGSPTSKSNAIKAIIKEVGTEPMAHNDDDAVIKITLENACVRTI
jgi:hypothetical protein